MAQPDHRVDGTGADAVAAYAALCAPTPAAAVGRPRRCCCGAGEPFSRSPAAGLPATATAAPELAGPGSVVAPPPPPAWVWRA